jgi:hypothetical protein
MCRFSDAGRADHCLLIEHERTYRADMPYRRF